MSPQSSRSLFVALVIAAIAAPAAAQDGGAAADQVNSVLSALPPESLVSQLPDETDPAVLAAASRVVTDPGRLPKIQVKSDGKTLDLPLQHTHVSAEISGFVARVEVTQTWKNPLKEPVEAVYVFPLPENSAVDDMKIRVGSRLIVAEIKRREDARRTYEDAKREGYTAALLEQERPNIFTQSIANMEPGVEIEVTLRYVQDLSYDSGEYEWAFPMVVGPRFIPGNAVGHDGTGWSMDTDSVPDASRITPPILGAGVRSGHDISLELVIAPGLPVIDLDVPTHDVDVVESDGATIIQLADHDSLPNRDFVLRFGVDALEPQGALYAHRSGKGGAFALVVQPPATDEEPGPRELDFVIDVSGSMSGLPLSMAKDAAREAIRRLRPTDTFNVITFAGQTARAFSHARPANSENVLLALRFVDAATAGGGTYLAQAVDDALSSAVEDGRDRTVVFLTDGYVGNETEILSKVDRFVAAHAEAGRSSRAFGLGIGSSVNRMLLDGIGKAGRGATAYLTTREDPARAVRTIFRMIDRPILSDVHIDWGGLAVSQVQPEVLPDLVATRPLVLHGRFKKTGRAIVRVSGMANGKRQEIAIPVVLPASETRNGAVETLWARAAIESLERRQWDGEVPKIKEHITALGLDYRLVTAYTSFVAVDRSKKVGNGKTRTVVQPVEAPEGVDPTMAAPAAALATTLSGQGMAVGHGAGGLGFKGTGQGGGGIGMGRVVGYGRVETGGGAGAGKASNKIAESAPRPVVRSAASAEVSGYADRNVVLGVLRRHQSAFKAAYEKALKTNPTLAGKIVVRFTIGKDGKVTKAEVTSDSLGDEDVSKRIVAIISKLVFPASEQEVTISYPFVFALN